MANTLYASFADPGLAEKAAGALLDHGVRAEDISLVQNEAGNTMGGGTASTDAGSVQGSTYGVDNTTTAYGTSRVTNDDRNLDDVDNMNAYGTTPSMGATTPDYGSNNMMGSTGTTGTGYGMSGSTHTGPMADNDNDVVDAADAGVAGTKSMGNRMAEYGDRAMATGADVVGAEGTQANYESAANQRDAIADNHMARSGNEMRDAMDMDNSSTNYGSGTSMGTGAGYSAGSTMGTSNTGDINRVDAEELRDTEHAAKQGISTTTAADAGSGAITGTGIGLGVGAVAALASLLVPGVGLVVGGGALAAALGGIAASAGAGAVAGAVTGYLKDQGMDENVAVEYDRVVTGGGALLAVHVPSGNVDEAEATQILTKYGATNVRSYATTSGGPYMG